MKGSSIEGLAELSANDYLILAGTLHGIHAITSRLSPIGHGSGVQIIEAETFKMTVFLTPTGEYAVPTTISIIVSDYSRFS